VELTTYWYITTFIFGTVIGSFLNVVIYRLHTGKSINTPSHCLSCGTPLRWYELFPVFSYLALRARCRTCGAYVPVRYLTVELLTGFSFLLLFHLFQHDIWLLLLNAILLSLLIVIVVYDIRHTIIPDELTYAIYGVMTPLLGLEFFHAGGSGTEELTEGLVGGFGAAGFFYLLWRVSKGRWIGLGDAKLALPLGALVGGMGAFSMVVFSFWIGAAVSVTILGFQRVLKKGKTHLLFLRTPLTMKSEVPFAPFLVLGFLLVYLFHANVFDIFYFVAPI
jgi:leader peptidase (prepilin peptidase)/N-methyltransferase